jgi:hypothetical protein
MGSTEILSDFGTLTGPSNRPLGCFSVNFLRMQLYWAGFGGYEKEVKFAAIAYRSPFPLVQFRASYSFCPFRRGFSCSRAAA